MREAVDSDARGQPGRYTPEVNDLTVGSTNDSDSGNQSGRTVAPERDGRAGSIHSSQRGESRCSIANWERVNTVLSTGREKQTTDSVSPLLYSRKCDSFYYDNLITL